MVWDGGFAVTAFEAIIAVTQDPLEILESLVDKSLIEMEHLDEIRFFLPVAVQDFLQEALASNPWQTVVEGARRRHLKWYADFAQPIVSVGHLPTARAWREARTEEANLRAAHKLALRTGATEEAVALGLGLATSLRDRGVATAEDILEETLQMEKLSATGRGWVALLQSKIASRRGDMAASLAHANYASECAKDAEIQQLATLFVRCVNTSLGRLSVDNLEWTEAPKSASPRVTAEYMMIRGQYSLYSPDRYADAEQAFDDAERACHQMGSQVGVDRVQVLRISLATLQGNHDLAILLADKHLKHMAYSQQERAKLLLYRANALLADGQLQQAISGFQRLLDLHNKVGHTRQHAFILSMLGHAHVLGGAYSLARPLFREALLRAREKNTPYLVALSLFHMGHLQMETHQWEAARETLNEGIAVTPSHQKTLLIFACGMLAGAEIRCGEPQRAEEHLQKARKIANTVGDAQLIVPGLVLAAEAYLDTGCDADAERLKQEVATTLSKLSAPKYFSRFYAQRLLKHDNT